MDINEELAGLLGLCWHKFIYTGGYGSSPDKMTRQVKKCSKCGKKANIYGDEYPDFTTDSGKIELLRLMEKRADWPEFLWFLWDKEGIQIGVVYKAFISNKGIPHIYITDTTGLLAKVAVEFLRREK
jgi:hypothetical protein